MMLYVIFHVFLAILQFQLPEIQEAKSAGGCGLLLLKGTNIQCLQAILLG